MARWNNKYINKVIQGDCLSVLKTFEDESIDMVMTSPPYWALRDYGTATWEGGDENCNHKKNPEPLSKKALSKSTIGAASSTGHALEGYKNICGKCGAKRIDKQIGLEPTFQEYINKLCDIFDEIKRVLKKEGSCWVNLGDTYASAPVSGKQGGFQGEVTRDNPVISNVKKPKTNLPEKSLLQIPSRFAIEMTNRGWILRNEIIWHKPNCMPSSVEDRFTVDFEKLFFFVKNKKYWFETQYEPMVENSDAKYRARIRANKKYNSKEPYKNNTPYATNKINSDVRLSAGENANRAFGDNKSLEKMLDKGRNKRTVWKITTQPYPEAHFAVYPPKLCETPIKAGCPKEGVVLDPFFGSGTTGAVARSIDRNWIGIELNPEYIKLAEDRFKQEQLF
jgi:DNA modification methylase